MGKKVEKYKADVGAFSVSYISGQLLDLGAKKSFMSRVLCNLPKHQGYFLVIAVCVSILLLLSEWIVSFCKTQSFRLQTFSANYIIYLSLALKPKKEFASFFFYAAIPWRLSDFVHQFFYLNSSRITLKYTLQLCLGFVLPLWQLGARRV